jgi:hydrogenase maturation protease
VKTLLLGMGNPILSDDAVGVRLARHFGKELRGVPGLTVIDECSVGGLNLLDVVAGFDRLIVVDSIRTAGGKPGKWHRFPGDALDDTMHLNNVHDANFATALELGRRMGVALPPRDQIHIFAVEVKDNITFREGLTRPLERAYPRYSEEILREIKEILGISGRKSGGPPQEGDHDDDP